MARKLTSKTKKEIREAFLVYTGSGIPERDVVGMCAKHTIGLLEKADEQPNWFEAEPVLSAGAQAAQRRPKNYEHLSGEEQWEIDRGLGILDWDGK